MEVVNTGQYMTDKEKLEMINLRNRLRSQREEIKRLMAENAELKKRLEEYEGVIINKHPENQTVRKQERISCADQ